MHLIERLRVLCPIMLPLAMQLHAIIKVVDANPGTAVPVAHTQIAAVRTDTAAMADHVV